MQRLDPNSESGSKQVLATLVLPHRNFRAWPTHELGGRGIYIPLQDALTRDWHGHAHFAAYYAPGVRRRLDKAAIAELSDGIVMHLAIYDIDCPAVHRATGGDPKSPASDEWWADMVERFTRLQSDHPGLFGYRTRGGARIVYRRTPVVHIRSEKEAESWPGLYVRECASLASIYGIVPDPKCRPWVNLFMLPHATRDGNESPDHYETFGDPSVPGSFGIVYESAHNDAAIALAATQRPWKEALPYLNAQMPRATAREIRTRLAMPQGPAKEGSRHEIIKRSVVNLSRQGASKAQRESVALALNETFDPPIPTNDIERLVVWTLKKFPEQHQPLRVVRSIDAAYDLLRSTIKAPPGHVDITAIASPTALGKTEVLVTNAIDRALFGLQTIISTPTVKLMYEFRERLSRALASRGLEIPVAFHRSLGTVTAQDGTPACKKAHLIPPLSGAGLYTERTLCQPRNLPKCEFFDGCQARETAGQEQQTGTIIITSHASLPGVMNQYQKAQVFIDEIPECFSSVQLRKDALYQEHFDLFTPAYKAACEALATSLFRLFEVEPVELVPFKVLMTQEVMDAFKECRGDTADSTLAPLLTPMARAYATSGRKDVLDRLQTVAAFARHAEETDRRNLPAWLTFSYHTDVPTVSLVRPSHTIAKLQEIGRHVTVVSAGAKELTSLTNIGLKVELKEIHAVSELPHTFHWIETKHVAKQSRMFDHGVLDHAAFLRLMRPLQKMDAEWHKAGHKTGLFVSKKAVCDEIRRITATDAVLKTKRERQIAYWWSQLNIRFEVAHFPLQGLDCYKDLDVCFILGDHVIPPNEAEARGRLTGETASQVIERIAVEATRQALGRLRELRSLTIKGLCLLGSYCPPERLEGAVMSTFRSGPTPEFDPATASLLQSHMDRHGLTANDVANEVGVTHKTVSNWLRCLDQIPEDVVDSLVNSTK